MKEAGEGKSDLNEGKYTFIKTWNLVNKNKKRKIDSTIATLLVTSLLRKPIKSLTFIKQHIVQSLNLLPCTVQVGGNTLLGLLFT